MCFFSFRNTFSVPKGLNPICNLINQLLPWSNTKVRYKKLKLS